MDVGFLSGLQTAADQSAFGFAVNGNSHTSSLTAFHQRVCGVCVMPNSAKLHHVVHLLATTLVNDYLMLLGEFCGIDNAKKTEQIAGNLMFQMPDGWALKRIWQNGMKGADAIDALCHEIIEMYECLFKTAEELEHDWIEARGREGIRWNGNLYSSA